jgi:hypothetical protein
LPRNVPNFSETLYENFFNSPTHYYLPTSLSLSVSLSHTHTE